MARVNFYEKPGCGTNRKQKAMLAAAGHEVVAHDLLTEPWTTERLLGFFGDAPLGTWVNPAAPRVKSGEIDAIALGPETLLEKMLADPLLIRRPLIEAEGRRCAGFDREPILSLLGEGEELDKAQGCSRPLSATPCPAPPPNPAAATAIAYHNRTKHRFGGYASGPETLDWDMQPDPFRIFDGAPRIELPLAPEKCDVAPPLSRASLGALLHLSLGLSAWKQFGPDRWALRVNPSSGNLHPTEAYVVALGLSGLDDGLYHYVSRDHALEQRCKTPDSDESRQKPDTPRVWIGLSSIHWREAWKYGERAFRYCQHDIGHALGALAYAAAALGLSARLVEGVSSAQIAQILGLEREADFGRCEREEPDLLLEIFAHAAAEISAPPAMEGLWAGLANLLDRRPMYRWPIIDEVAHATLGGASGHFSPPSEPPRAHKKPITAESILGRRSAQHFDSQYIMSSESFFALLDALLVRDETPWNVWKFQPRLHLVLFVHRVEGLAPGLYALPRDAGAIEFLRAALDGDFPWTRPEGAPDHPPLFLLKPGDLRGAARRLFCNQAIAGNCCFAVAMLAEFDAPLRENPWFYRLLHWEAGLIGQSLYLESEARDLQGTGIGCFFDDETHAFLGLKTAKLQTIYHFTVGRALTDARIATEPAYPGRQRPKEF
ncbi:SagB family peptide dehydrogenase [uncultured Rhodoblastus sp.]|uniref:SagB family peptide dehydrogenase n=1 Tax=uncultured Rhodoblastus sp. TaxID=543037 RepID=UPI0025CF73BD|nr:SagB family peptide dehydrogenase [uncultured Rhodoblastus sp.]